MSHANVKTANRVRVDERHVQGEHEHVAVVVPRAVRATLTSLQKFSNVEILQESSKICQKHTPPARSLCPKLFMLVITAPFSISLLALPGK